MCGKVDVMLGGVAAALQWVAAVPTSPILHKNYCTAAAVEVEKESRSAGCVKNKMLCVRGVRHSPVFN